MCLLWPRPYIAHRWALETKAEWCINSSIGGFFRKMVYLKSHKPTVTIAFYFIVYLIDAMIESNRRPQKVQLHHRTKTSC